MRPGFADRRPANNTLASGYARSAESNLMNRMAAARVATASHSQKKAVDALVRELLDGGVDLRSVSLNEVKRRLSTRLRRQRRDVLAAGTRAVA
ncbi:MAG: hypothetical protein H0T47_11730 [Planctomycetaceae bacterium]|nr:hypothetical protein [Planctomycetaceae bacterium]